MIVKLPVELGEMGGVKTDVITLEEYTEIINLKVIDIEVYIDDIVSWYPMDGEEESRTAIFTKGKDHVIELNLWEFKTALKKVLVEAYKDEAISDKGRCLLKSLSKVRN